MTDGTSDTAMERISSMTGIPEDLLGDADAVLITDHVFVRSGLDGLLEGMKTAGYETTEAAEPFPAGTLYVSPGYECTRSICGHCGKTSSAVGCQAESGKWCGSCGKLMHLGFSSTLHGSTRSTFEMRFSGEGYAEQTFRLDLIDYFPETKEVLLGVEPRPSHRNDHMDDLIAKEAAALSKLPLWQRLEDATTRMVIEDGEIRHVPLAQPEPAIRMAYPVRFGVGDEREANPNGEGVYLKADGGRVYHKSQNVKIVAGRQVDGSTMSLYVTDAASLYPLETTPDILNVAIEHFGSQLQGIIQGYLKGESGFEARTLDRHFLGHLRQFLAAFTHIDMPGWDAMMERTSGLHAARRWVAMATFAHPEHNIRMAWRVGSGYSNATPTEARAYVEQFLKPIEAEAKKRSRDMMLRKRGYPNVREMNRNGEYLDGYRF